MNRIFDISIFYAAFFGVVFRLPSEQKFAPDSHKLEKTGPPTIPAAAVRVSLIWFLSSKTLPTLRVAICRTAVCERLNVRTLASQKTLPEPKQPRSWYSVVSLKKSLKLNISLNMQK